MGPVVLGSRRVSLSADAFQETGGQVPAPQEQAGDRVVERGPESVVEPAEEESARVVAREESVTNAVAAGRSISKAERWRGIFHRRVDAFRHALRGDSPARVEPRCVQSKPGAAVAKTEPRAR